MFFKNVLSLVFVILNCAFIRCCYWENGHLHIPLRKVSHPAFSLWMKKRREKIKFHCESRAKGEKENIICYGRWLSGIR